MLLADRRLHVEDDLSLVELEGIGISADSRDGLVWK